MFSTNLRILVVDDFGTMRRVIRNILKEIKFSNVVEAENGQSALTILERDQIQLIISDWNMPVMSGIELLEKVRADSRFKHIPFIMVTAEGQRENVLKAVEKGVTNYIVKPFTPVVLEQKIRAIFKHLVESSAEGQEQQQIAQGS